MKPTTIAVLKLMIPLVILLSVVTSFISCSNRQVPKTDSTANVITEKIMYDVTIKTPETDGEWWRNNIEPSQREKFINALIDEVISGKRVAYDYLSDTVKLDKEELNRIVGTKYDTVFVENPANANDIKKVPVTTTFDRKSITKIRFMEQWIITGSGFDKKVIAISPLKEVYDNNTGELRGQTPLFWIFFNK